jgi:import receptor subunit TOM22
MANAIIASQGGTLQQVTSTSLYASKKLFTSFKKAAWIAATTVLVLLVPLVIEMDRDTQITEMEKEQLNVLTGGSSTGKAA